MGTAIIICSVGAFLGLLFALIANVVVLPLVLTSLDTYQGGRYFHLRELTRLVYRYVMPIVFACAGAAAAYFVFVADG
jgi:E3 ubiquitin-protein ligase DOA10